MSIEFNNPPHMCFNDLDLIVVSYYLLMISKKNNRKSIAVKYNSIKHKQKIQQTCRGGGGIRHGVLKQVTF